MAVIVFNKDGRDEPVDDSAPFFETVIKMVLLLGM